MFTIYILTGAGNGSAMLFSLLVPIGLCYFVNVKFGIILPYELLLHILTESMDYVIEKMKYKPALDYHRKILDAMKAKDEVLAERGVKVSFFPLRHQFS